MLFFLSIYSAKDIVLLLSQVYDYMLQTFISTLSYDHNLFTPRCTLANTGQGCSLCKRSNLWERLFWCYYGAGLVINQLSDHVLLQIPPHPLQMNHIRNYIMYLIIGFISLLFLKEYGHLTMYIEGINASLSLQPPFSSILWCFL